MTRLARLAARTVTAIVTVAVLAACGSGGDASLTSGVPGGAPASGGTAAPAGSGGSAAPLNPKPTCQLLTPDDVGRAVGNPVRAPTGEGKFCFWGTQVDKGTSADVTVNIPAPGRSAEVCSSQRNSLPKEAKQEPVSGIGSSALWAWQQVSLLLQGNFLVCWPDAVVVVNVTGEKDQAALRAAANSLAQTVRGRL